VPRDNQCARDNEGCLTNLLGASVRKRSRVSATRARVQSLSKCRPWFGPSVAALACARPGLSRAIRRQRLGRKSSLLLSVERRSATAAADANHHGSQRAATAPALAQYLGSPLRTGSVVRLGGAIPRRTTLLLRLLSGGGIYQAVIGLRDSRPLTIRVVRQAGRPALRLRPWSAGSVRIRPERSLTRTASRGRRNG
jgi:hypothetical protein